jgi:hypothetical protein
MTTRRDDGFPVTGPWSFRDMCEHDHGWIAVDNDWLQCRLCWWCKPTYGYDLPKLEKLPAILKGRVLPPLSGKIDLSQLYANAGFVFDDDRSSVLSICRVVIVQHTYGSVFDSRMAVRRCGAHVRFKGYGWKEAAVFMETGLSKLLAVLAKAEPRKPKALWLAIQEAFEINPKWRAPWG